MIVYTYFDQDPELSPSYLDITHIWAEAWSEAGFTPVILDIGHAQRHPRYRELLDRVDTYPCVNSRKYQAACFVRWLALDSVGGGLAVDADVLPTAGISKCNIVRDHCYGSRNITFFEDTYCPCAVFADKDGAAFIVDWLCRDTGVPPSPTSAGPNISDQEVLREMATQLPIRCVPLVGNFPDPFRPFIHYSTCALANAGLIGNTDQKAEAIRKILHNG